MGNGNSKYNSKNDASPIKHVVYIMYENHSFDQIYGGFDEYKLTKGNNFLKEPFNESVVTTPEFDFPHLHHYVMEQLGLTKKNKNADNSGFEKVLEDYDKKSQIPEEIHKKRILEDKSYLKPGTLPVFHRLASEYTVCNNYFSSYPGDTWCNRYFALSGTSKGQIENGFNIDQLMNPSVDLYLPDQTTLFDRLNERGVSWKAYHHGIPFCLILNNMWRPDCLDKLHDMADFYKHCESGELPAFSYIEPKYYGAGQSDMHPPSNKLNGDHLLGKIYCALRSNQALWESTLLIVNFDEHGGYGDHVFPPKTIAPDNHHSQYSFTNLGVRVPCLLISPYMQKGGVISDVMDHTSILHYLIDKYGLKQLGKRAAVANTFTSSINSKIRTDTVSAEEISSLITPFDDKTYEDYNKKAVDNDFHNHFWLTVLRIMTHLKIVIDGHQLPIVAEIPKHLEYFISKVKERK